MTIINKVNIIYLRPTFKINKYSKMIGMLRINNICIQYVICILDMHVKTTYKKK